MGKKIIALNKRASYDYEIIDTYEAGIVLYGSEVKSIRDNNLTLNGSFVIVKKNELFILNMNIAKYKFSTNKYSFHDPLRTRKLLLHKKEIGNIMDSIKLQKLTAIPLCAYFKNGKIKLEIATSRGKKNYDKRLIIKKRDEEREISRYKK